MALVPLISPRSDLQSLVGSLCKAELQTLYEIEHLTTTEDASDFLTTEIPEIMFIDFGSPAIDGFAMLDMVMSDPWLLHGGIIGICNDYAQIDRIEKIRGSNVIVALMDEDLKANLPKILRIIETNHRVLFQREIGIDLAGNISGVFVIDNDLIEATCYTNLICNFLYNTNRIDVDSKESLRVALTELIINAIEHGNCNISYDEKTALLESGGFIGDLIREKCNNQTLAKRRVTFEYVLEVSHARFIVTDEGDGFDWRSIKDASKLEHLMELHGRGILMARRYTQNLSFSEKGNSVSFEMTYPPEVARFTPALFSSIAPVEFNKGDCIFRQGETSNFLYYIVKGEFDVEVNNNTVSYLGPDDIFMGEMSFLLDNRRSATVRARTPGRLIKLSKKEFVNAIRTKPHYALFLARLLAQRIQRANFKTAK